MEMGSDHIKNIIFDLGGVLLNLNLNACIKAFHALGFKQNIMDREQIFSHKIFSRFQNGDLNVEEFYSHLREIIGNPNVSDEKLKEAWNKMVEDIPAQNVAVLQKLKVNFNIYLFSNTNPIHVDKIENEFYQTYGFSFASLFTKVYYSHEIFNSKPRVSSYLKVVKDAGINASETLFVDDLEKNIIGAQNAGLKGLWLKPGMNISQVFEK